MKHKLAGAGDSRLRRHYVILEAGRRLFLSSENLRYGQGIRGGKISGIGTLKDPELGFFDLEKKEYVRKVLKGEFEILAMPGNISGFNGDTVVHIHITLSDAEFKAFGGHLFKGVVTGTAEMVIETSGETVERKHNDKNNLNLIEF